MKTATAKAEEAQQAAQVGLTINHQLENPKPPLKVKKIGRPGAAGAGPGGAWERGWALGREGRRGGEAMRLSPSAVPKLLPAPHPDSPEIRPPKQAQAALGVERLWGQTPCPL